MGILVKFGGLALFFFAASQVLTFGNVPPEAVVKNPNEGFYFILAIIGVVGIFVGAGMEDKE